MAESKRTPGQEIATLRESHILELRDIILHHFLPHRHSWLEVTSILYAHFDKRMLVVARVLLSDGRAAVDCAEEPALQIHNDVNLTSINKYTHLRQDSDVQATSINTKTSSTQNFFH